MNRKIYVGGTAIVLIAIIGIFALSNSPTIQLSNDGRTVGTIQTGVVPLEPSISAIEIVEITEKKTYINLKIDVTNKNQRSIILQLVLFSLYDYDNDKLITKGQIGERADGMVVGFNFFTVLSNTTITLTEKIVLRNDDLDDEFLELLKSDDVSWQVVGNLIYNLSSMTMGGENEAEFDLRY
ncbi:MAG: hypothetical protein R1F52_02760 [Candidatus Nitrosoabyssus spongiisocia]|nr:MAG: hypothetical protein R1F52_02760 [Nitrosopumilaceae archaeon AB1(1)]